MAMAFQSSAAGILAWRVIAGMGIGVELVTIDAYIAELVPKHLRGTCLRIQSSRAIHRGAMP